jgi:zinc and cadmium transporter
VTFTVDVVTGALAAVGMVLHEFPEGIIMVALLKHHGYARRKAAWIAFLTAGITTPAGALASYPVVQHLGPGFLGPLLALSGGALVYLGAAHLLPVTLKKQSAATMVCLGR